MCFLDRVFKLSKRSNFVSALVFIKVCRIVTRWDHANAIALAHGSYDGSQLDRSWSSTR